MQRINIFSTIKSIEQMQPRNCTISPSEMQHALTLLLREAQQAYPLDVSTKLHLRIFEDNEGQLRCRGRFPQHASMITSTMEKNSQSNI